MNPTVTVAGALDSATPPPHCRNRTQDDSSNFASTNRAVNGTKTEKRSKRKQSRPLQRIPTKQRKETNPDSLNAREYTLPLRIQPQHPTTRNFRSSKTKKKKTRKNYVKPGTLVDSGCPWKTEHFDTRAVQYPAARYGIWIRMVSRTHYTIYNMVSYTIFETI